MTTTRETSAATLPTDTTSARRWGATLFAGGLFLAAAYSFYPSSAHSSAIRPAAALGLIGVLLTIAGVIAYQALQDAGARVSGRIGAGLLVLGLAALEIPHLVLGLFAPSKLYDLDAYHAGFFGSIEFPGIIVIAIGTIILAVATARARFYRRPAVLALVATIVVAGLTSSLGALGDALHAPAPTYFIVGLLGLAMRRPRTAHAQQIDLTRSATTSVA